MASETDSLVAEGLTKFYSKRPVVLDLSLSINQGEVVGLLGPNGAGKTTTFYMLVGMIYPDRGRVILKGEDITDLPMHLRAKKAAHLSAPRAVCIQKAHGGGKSPNSP